MINLGRTTFPEASRQISSCIPLAHDLPLNNHWKREWGGVRQWLPAVSIDQNPGTKADGCWTGHNQSLPNSPTGSPQDQSSGGIPQVIHWSGNRRKLESRIQICSQLRAALSIERPFPGQIGSQARDKIWAEAKKTESGKRGQGWGLRGFVGSTEQRGLAEWLEGTVGLSCKMGRWVPS